MYFKKNSSLASGQAMIEYLLIFSFVTFFSINLVKSLGNKMLTTVGYLGFEISEQLTVGVCSNDCFMNGFKNQDAGQ
jgi:hypothetical protein